MIFAHDTELALQAAAALVNTMPGTLPGEVQEEDLRTVADLDRFLDTWTWTGGRTGTRAELDAVRAFRPRLRRPGRWTRTDLVDLVNGFLREGEALPQLVDHDGFGWHIHATPADAPLQTRMAVEAAMALVDILRTDERDRLKVCARRTATTCSSTCPRTGPSGSATRRAATARTSLPTARARPHRLSARSLPGCLLPDWLPGRSVSWSQHLPQGSPSVSRSPGMPRPFRGHASSGRGQARPSNRLVTEPSSKTSRIAMLISGAMDSTSACRTRAPGRSAGCW